MKRLLMMLMLIGLVGSVQAAIFTGTYSGTYVDAVVGADQASSNTWVYDTGTYPNLTDWENGGSAIGKWWDREGYGEGTIGENAVLGANNSSATVGDVPLLVTTITGLTVGQDYNVSVAYIATATETSYWGVQAGFSDASLVLHDQYTGTVTGADAGGRNGYESLVGIATADVSGEIAVIIGGVPDALSSSYRTWYDGVVYSVVPEPTTLMLLGFGGLLFRKRK